MDKSETIMGGKIITVQQPTSMWHTFSGSFASASVLAALSLCPVRATIRGVLTRFRKEKAAKDHHDEEFKMEGAAKLAYAKMQMPRVQAATQC